MKIGLFILCFFNAMIVKAQVAKVSPEPFKGAKKIICVAGDRDTANILLDKMAKILVTKGFNIDKLDKEYNVLTTEDKEIKHVRYVIRMHSEGNKLVVTSKWKPTHTVELWGVKAGESFYDTEYAKSKANIGNAIFKEILEILNQAELKDMTFTQ